MKHLQFLSDSNEITLALVGSYDLRLVVLSIFMASLASYAAFYVSEKLGEKKLARTAIGWLIIGATIQGIGVWAMHFIAMLAFRLPVEINYNPTITTFSVLPAILASAVVITTTKKRQLSQLSFIRNAILMGSGIGLMHYSGMSAMQGNIVMRYSLPLFTTSIFVAVALSFCALHLKVWAERSVKLTSYIDWRLIGAALTMGFAISTMHYTGMSSTYFFESEKIDLLLKQTLSPNVLAWSISIVCINIITLLLIVHRTSQQITIRDLELSNNQALRANKELKRAQLQLVQSAKLASLGEISAGLAHELNQPLGAIKLSTQLLQKMISNKDINQDKIDITLEKIVRLVDRATKIINHLKTFSREESFSTEEADINWIINQSFILISESLKIEGVTLKTELANNLPKVYCDILRTEQVFSNLINNAKYAVSDQDTKLITIRSYKRGNMIYIEIEDTGCGIEPSIIEKIFDPFFTTKPVGKGTGLGMSISHSIIAEHNGELTVKSVTGKGTCFTASLPIAA